MSDIAKINLNGVEYTIGSSGSGLTDDAKQALLQIASKVGYIDTDGSDYYDALEEALYPPANLVSISAVYVQSGVVYDTDTLDSLKPDLTVTALWDDSTTSIVTNYTMSGTLSVGTSTITVGYAGKTTTFSVTVSEYTPQSYSLSAPTSTGSANAIGVNRLVDGKIDLSGISEGSNRYYLQDMTKPAVMLVETNAGSYSLGFIYAVINGELYSYNGSWHNLSQSESEGSAMDMRNKSATTPAAATEIMCLSRSANLSKCTMNEVTGD